MRLTIVRSLSFTALALSLTAGLHAQQADTSTNPFANDPAAVAAGMAVYNSTCVACHEPAGTGGRGPALNTGHLQHGDGDFEIFQVIRGGIAGTQMPNFSGLSTDNTWRLVSYIKSLSTRPAPPAQVAATGNAAAGQSLFFGSGNCTSCHEMNGRGADLATDLSAEGARPVNAIRDGVMHRPAAAGRGGRGAAPAARVATATLANGKTVDGIIRAEDTFTLHLKQRDGKLLMLDKKNVRNVSAPVPLSNPQIAASLSSTDVDNLVAFLAAQKARNLAEAAKANPAPVLTDAQLVAGQKNPQNWTSYWGSYDGHHFSELKQITPKNVKTVQARWTASLPGNSALESTPVVVDGVMYVSGPPGDVYAIDARTGIQVWRFHRAQDVRNPGEINPFNKGVAVLDGRVFFGTLDNNLIALDAHTGRELWEKHLAETLDGYTLTGAPLAVRGKIIMGMSGGEMGVRGWLDAYDPATGNRLWRVYTIPKPDEPGGNTWPRDTWQYGGGATWLTGQYDPELNTLYWSIGNPGPDYNPDIRKGDNLYTDCVLAIDPDTGKLKWYYQMTPNDGHDWDATEDNILADLTINGQKRRALLHADRNGMYYVLDRVTGKLIFGKPFVKVTWTDGFDANGRVIVKPESEVTAQGVAVYPAVAATNFQAPSYDKDNGVIYLNFTDSQGFVASAPAVYQRGSQYLGRGTGTPPPAPTPPVQGTMALQGATGKVLWKHVVVRNNLSAGVLATRGGVVFVATAEGNFMALDKKTGKALWNFKMPGNISASPMSYAVDGKQFVAITAGNMVYSFALPN
ncbi:MAG: PQQ-dependent dehydrogenase, methanol/ethanol family [Alphaproteobacteria bacterium]|nr:PQQ-dependent dehydrogenase, methanol/ethanol family [Alphaproteobacteria bacterium]